MRKILLFFTLIIFNFTVYSQCVTPQAPSAITGVGATLNWTIDDPNVTSVNIKWRQQGCATSWNTATQCVAIVSNVTGVSFLLDTLSSNTEYEWRIRENGSCNQSWTNGTNFTTTGIFNYIGAIGSSMYYVYNNTTSWTDANTLCNNAGGHLASINSQQESDDLNTLLGNSNNPPFGPNAHWIGLIDGNNNWENGDPLTFTNYDGSYTSIPGDYMYIQTNGLWDNSPNNGSQANNGIHPIMEMAGCTPSLDQAVSQFIPNPISGYMQWSENNLTLTNTANCDVNIRPEFIISHANTNINQGDILIEWYSPLGGGFWANIPYNIDNNGNAYGYWSPTSNSSNDSTGYNFPSTSPAQLIPVRVSFMNPNNSPPNGAAHGLYSAEWITYEVDSLGNIIQALTPVDTIELNFIDCSYFTIDTIIATNVTCNGSGTGSAMAVVTIGSGNYDYVWDNGQTSENAVGLGAGTYSVTVTDLDSNCSATQSITITEPDTLTASFVSTNVTCNGGNDGSIVISANGSSSVGLYDYIWTTHPGISGSSNNNLIAGTYVIDVIDLTCGDITQLTINITEPDPLTINTTTSGDNSSCDPNICNGIFGVSVNGENSPYTFTWNTGGYTDSMKTDLCAGTYNISITDANGCNTISSGNIIINNNPFTPTLCLSSSDALCNGDSSGFAVAVITSGGCGGGTSNLTYCASTPADTNYSNIANVVMSGDNGTSINNNTSGQCDAYEDYTNLSVSLTPGQNYSLSVDLGTCDGSGIEILDSAGVYIDWNQDGDFDDTGEEIEVFAGLQSPNPHTISINVPSNAVGGATRMRIVNQAQTGNSFYPDGPVTECAVGTFSGSFLRPWYGATEDYTINITSSTISGTYIWSNGSTDSVITNVPAGTYICTITDQNNCTATDTIQ